MKAEAGGIMKWTHLGLWAAIGMGASGASVFAMTPRGGFGASPETSKASPSDSSTPESTTRDASLPDATNAEGASRAAFVTDDTVRVDARLGHTEVARGASTESFVMLELKGSDAAALATSTPVHLGLVIDRSGSMRGRRIENAKSAAISAVEHLADGDTVSIVAFDTATTAVVPPTRLDPTTRASIRERIQAISLGGDTCISCGIDASEAFMETTPAEVRRMIVLSDGDTNSGVRDVLGMRALAHEAHTHGSTISSIGVDLAYNERIMAAIAEGGEGLHHFVAEPSDLARVFESEALSARDTVAQNVEARIKLEPGVELVEVLDRAFTRSGGDLVIPVGSLSKGEVKTVLCRVRVPATQSDSAEVAAIEIVYRDLAKSKDGSATGSLAARPADKASDVDPFVQARVERSQTASALQEANALFRQGKVDQARQTLGSRQALLKKTRTHFDFDDEAPFAPSRGRDAKSDVDRQLDTISRAESGFATPPPATAAPKPGAAKPSPADPFERNAKQNQADATFERR
jgi:Ca-activated chloride channel family protein